MDAAALVLDGPGTTHPAQLFGHRQTGLKPVLMEAGPEMGAAEPDAALTLQTLQFLLRLDGGRVEDRMLVQFAAQQASGGRRTRRV